MTRLLVVTNDFPPRPGGIQTFVHELVSRLDPADVVVYTSRSKGWEEFDREQPFEVVREDTSVLLPTPGVRRRAAELVKSRSCEPCCLVRLHRWGCWGRRCARQGRRASWR